MAIANYTRPQLLIRQLLDRTAAATERQLNAFVVGPQFDLFRYTDASERADQVGTAFAYNANTTPANRQLVAYEGLGAAHKVDTGFTRLFGENLEGRLLLMEAPVTVADLYNVRVNDLSEPNKLHVEYRAPVLGTPVVVAGIVYTIGVTFGGAGHSVAPLVTITGDGTGAEATATIANGEVTGIVITNHGSGYTSATVSIANSNERVNVGSTLTTEDWDLLTELRGRPVRSGDVLYSTYNATTFRRSVRGVERESVAAHYGSDAAKTNGFLAASASNPAKVDTAVVSGFTAPSSWACHLTLGGLTGLVLNNIGINFAVNDVINVVQAGGYGNGAQLTVNTINGGGGITGFTITNVGVDYDGTNPVTLVPVAPSVGINQTVTSFTAGTASVAADWSGLIEGAKYLGNYGDRYTVTVTHSGDATTARVRVRSASGAFSADDLAVTKPGNRSYIVTSTALGGLVLSLRAPNTSTNLRSGDQFIFNVKGVYLPLFIANKVGSIKVTNGGTSYATAPSISFTGGGGTGAAATAHINGLLNIVITNGGTGYHQATTTVDVLNTGGPGGVATAVPIITGGIITDVVITYAGYGYTSTGWAVTFTDSDGVPGSGGAATANRNTGKVADIVVTNGGRDYTTAPAVIITSGTGSLAAATAILDGPGSARDLTIAGTYTGPADTTYTISVVTGSEGATDGFNGAIVRVTDSSGIDTAQEYTVVQGATNYLGTFGLTFDFPASLSTPTQGGLLKGDAYFVHAVAEAAVGSPAIIVLSGQAADVSGWTEGDRAANMFDIDLRTVYTGEVLLKGDSADAPNLQWEAGNETVGGVLVKDHLKINVTDRDTNYEWVEVQNSTKARLFSHWRGLVPAAVSASIKLYNTEDAITTAFGKIDKDNHLAYAASKALSGSQGRAIYLASLRTNDLAGYTAILRKAERVDGIYAIAPLSYDSSVLAAVQVHVDAMATDSAKLWRRAYFGTKNPGAFLKISTTSEGNRLDATVLSSPSGNVRVVAADANFLTNGIVAGDLFRTSFSTNEWDEATYAEYVVFEVLEEDELILETGPASPITNAIRAEVWKPDNAASQVVYVANKSDSYANRRIASVWADAPYDVNAESVIEPVELFFVCSEIAGLRSAVFPQQGLTNTEILSAEQAPNMFTKYTEDDLNVAAAGGTFIITQEAEDAVLFIRHQLTTQTNFNALHWEDSVGTNLDEISYAFKDILQPYIGRRNATPETVEEIETKSRDILNARRTAPDGATSVGPQIINWTDLVVEIDPVFKDRINVSVRLELPLPINSIIVTLNATTISDTVPATV